VLRAAGASNLDRLSKKCGSLDVSQPYVPPRSATRIAIRTFTDTGVREVPASNPKVTLLVEEEK
jgi:hypothetical protein